MALFNSIPEASKSLRVLALLLSYPDAQQRAHLPDLRDALHAERALSASRLAELDALIATLGRKAVLEVEAEYVELFDRGRATSLHLFEHVHGDSRDRGPAMIDLTKTYEQAGLFLGEGELPDFVPVVLEFASTLEPRPVTVGLGYTHGYLDDFAPEPHDLPLDAILNDNGVVWPF